jgi:tetratricopeptide (TPR) repeat protein
LLLLAACATPEERAAKYIASADQMLAKGDLAKARLEAQNAIQIAPKNSKARWILAQVAEKTGDFGQMLGNLEIVIAEDKSNLPARVMLATVLVFGQDYEGARLLLDQVNEINADDPSVRILSARLHFQAGEVDAGIADLDFVLKKDPKNVTAALLRGTAVATKNADQGLADLKTAMKEVAPAEGKPLRDARLQILLASGRRDELEKELVKLVKEFPLEDYAPRLAEIYASTNRPDEAEAAMREAIKARPDDINLKVALAQFQSRGRKRPEVAEQTLLGFVKESPDMLELKVLLGTFYEAQQRDKDAQAQYEAVAGRAPATNAGLAARNRLAALALRKRDVQAASKIVDEILATAPDNAAALNTRADIAISQGRNADAVADLRAVLRKNPDDAESLMMLGATHVRLGDNSLAEDAYRRLLQINPADSKSKLALANVLAATDRGDEAETLYRELLKADARDILVLNAYVDLLLSNSDLPAAEKQARAMVQLNDPQGLGPFQLGRVLLARREYKAAVAQFEKAIERSPDFEPALEALASAWNNAGQPQRAVEFFRAHLKRFPDQSHSRRRLGATLAVAGELDEARLVLNEVIAGNPTDWRAYRSLASAYPADRDERIRVLQQGLKAVPSATQLTNLLGTEFELAGKIEDAISVYKQQLDKAPASSRPQIANSLAALLLDHRSDRESHQQALQLVQPLEGSRDPAILDTIGWAFYRLGQYDRAVTFLELAAATGARVPVMRYHLGMTYLGMENRVGARQEFEKAVEFADGKSMPGLAEAAAALARLEGDSDSRPVAKSAP